MSAANNRKSVLDLILAISAGLLLSRKTRRRIMMGSVLLAAAMLFFGSVILNDFLVARPFLFLVFWMFCAAITGFLMLLAIYDLLALRREERLARKALRKSIFEKDESS